MVERMTREEAIQYLTMQQDLANDLLDNQVVDFKTKYLQLLSETGDKIGYAPAFRCLVKGLGPEESIRWGK